MTTAFIPTPEHCSNLERLYAGAPTNRYWHPHIAVGNGRADVTMPLREEFNHPAGAAHGSAYFKVLDDAMFFAVNSLTDEFVLTSSLTLHLLRPIVSGSLRASGIVVHASRRLWVAEGIAYDDANRKVAWASGTFMTSGKRIAEFLPVHA